MDRGPDLRVDAQSRTFHTMPKFAGDRVSVLGLLPMVQALKRLDVPVPTHYWKKWRRSQSAESSDFLALMSNLPGSQQVSNRY